MRGRDRETKRIFSYRRGGAGRGAREGLCRIATSFEGKEEVNMDQKGGVGS